MARWFQTYRVFLMKAARPRPGTAIAIRRVKDSADRTMPGKTSGKGAELSPETLAIQLR